MPHLMLYLVLMAVFGILPLATTAYMKTHPNNRVTAVVVDIGCVGAMLAAVMFAGVDYGLTMITLALSAFVVGLIVSAYYGGRSPTGWLDAWNQMTKQTRAIVFDVGLIVTAMAATAFMFATYHNNALTFASGAASIGLLAALFKGRINARFHDAGLTPAQLWTRYFGGRSPVGTLRQ